MIRTGEISRYSFSHRVVRDGIIFIIGFITCFHTLMGFAASLTLDVPAEKDVRYTRDGSTPSLTSTQYTEPLTQLSVTNLDVRIVTRTNETTTTPRVLQFTYTAPALIAPILAGISEGERLTETRTLTLTTEPNNATIYYTTNGTAPTATSLRYTGPIATSTWPDGTMTLKAAAVDNGNWSDTTTCTFTVALRPGAVTASGPNWGSIAWNPLITLTEANPESNTKFYYTIDGSEPTATSARYTEPIRVSTLFPTNGTYTFRAVAIRNGFTSDVTKTAVVNGYPAAATIRIIKSNLFDTETYKRGSLEFSNVSATTTYSVTGGSETAYVASEFPKSIKLFGAGTKTVTVKTKSTWNSGTANHPPMYTTSTFTYTYDSSDPTNNARWMDRLSDHVTITQLSLPGTHESGATTDPAFAFGFAQCQSGNIREQLDLGVRVLDIRIYQDMSIYHGTFYMGHSFADVMTHIKSFLTANPSEAVIVSIKDEKDSGGQDVWTTKVTEIMNNTGCWYKDRNGVDFTLGEIRGKFIILRRFGYISNGTIDPGSWPADWYNDNPSGNPPSLIQDAYSYDESVSSKIGAKWGYVTQFFNYAMNNPRNNGILYINFLSATAAGIGGSTPGAWASSVNGKLGDWINPKAGQKFRLGILMQDFVHRNADLPPKIYKTNAFSEL